MVRRCLKGEALASIFRSVRISAPCACLQQCRTAGDAAAVPDRRPAGRLRAGSDCRRARDGAGDQPLAGPTSFCTIRPYCRRSRAIWPNAGCTAGAARRSTCGARPDGPALAQIDRGAIPSFGIQASGCTSTAGATRRRSVSVGRQARQGQAAGPRKLDHIVAGAIPAGLGPMQTLLKEAEEEAAIPAELAATAVQVGVVEYAMGPQRGPPARRAVLLRPRPARRFPAKTRRRRGRSVRIMADPPRRRDRGDDRRLQVQRQSGPDRPVHTPGTGRRGSNCPPDHDEHQPPISLLAERPRSGFPEHPAGRPCRGYAPPARWSPSSVSPWPSSLPW